MRLLDLFCGAGGAAIGYWQAGFEVVGVDIEPQLRYPFEFHQADALEFSLDDFDVIHASPPCQKFSSLRHFAFDLNESLPDLIWPTRLRLEKVGVPYVIENVPGAPLRNPILLCGSMFDLGARGADGVWRQLRRHRLFESSVRLTSPTCRHEGETIGVYGGGPTYRKKGEGRGGHQGTSQERRTAMGLNSLTREELNQAIPPAYTEYIGTQLLAFLN